MNQQQLSEPQEPQAHMGAVAPVLPAQSLRRRRRLLALIRGLLRALVLLVLAGAALFAVVAGAAIWLITARSHDRREAWRWTGVLAVIGLGIYAVWLWQGASPAWFWHAILFDLTRHLWRAALAPILQVWTANTLFGPLVALLLAVLFRRSKQPAPQPVKGMSLQEYEQAARVQQTTVTQALTTFERMMAPAEATHELAAAPPLPLMHTDLMVEVLGNYEGGELLQWVYAGKFAISPDFLRMHGILVGEPAFGKTTTLIRLLAIARRMGRKVIYLDLKGSKQTAALFLATMALLGVSRVKMYPWQALDGWRGDTRALFNRLMEQIDSRTHPFYRGGVGATVISLAVNAPPGPPRNSYEFLERLDVRWLKRAYVYNGQAQREIRATAEYLNGLALIYSGFFRGIRGALDGSWSFEDTDAAYIGVDGTSHKEEAASLGRYIVEDAAHYATDRKDPADQVFLVIDEFGVLRSTNATDLYERVRESGMSIYAAAQSYESLGQERNNLLAAAAVKILHRTGAPEPIIKFAGEREVPQFSRYVGGSGGSEAELLPATNRPGAAGNRPDVIMRQQKEYSVPVEEVQRLGLGKIALLYGGEGAIIQVLPLALPETLVQAARRYLAERPQFTPLAPPKRSPPPKGEQSPEREQSGERRKPRRDRAGGSNMREPEAVTGPSPDLAQPGTHDQDEAAIDYFRGEGEART